MSEPCFKVVDPRCLLFFSAFAVHQMCEVVEGFRLCVSRAQVCSDGDSKEDLDLLEETRGKSFFLCRPINRCFTFRDSCDSRLSEHRTYSLS